MSFNTTQTNAPITIFMAGDSTMSTKEVKDYPETGWGVPFSHFFSDNITVTNLAKNGRSTKTFQTDGLWDKITSQVCENDYVIIQFGHNDQAKDKPERYTTIEQFKLNLEQFIADIRQRHASCILMTPITRRHFDTNGKIKETHPLYADAVREVANKTQVSFIDMEEVTKSYFQFLGDDGSRLRFMHIEPDLHPNYPIGVQDDTHLNPLGAVEVAQLVLQQLKKIQHPLTSMLRTPDPKHLELG